MIGKLQLLGEDDFRPFMDNTIRPWIQETMEEGYLAAADGLKLHYCCLPNPQEIGRIMIMHGYCEFFGKYHELSWYLWQQGYGIYFLEQRGHGYSDRDGVENDMVYVSDFNEYVEDQKLFYDTIVSKDAKSPIFLLAHSMGGLVGARYIEKYTDDFKRVILSSPLLKMNSGSIPAFATYILVFYSILARKQKAYIPGHGAFDGVRNFIGSSTKSEARYNYTFDQRLLDKHYQTYSACYAWSRAALRAVRQAQRDVGKVKNEILLLQAGQDHMVKIEGQDRFASKLKNCKLVRFPHARHEIFNSLMEDREKYYKEILSFLKKE